MVSDFGDWSRFLYGLISTDCPLGGMIVEQAKKKLGAQLNVPPDSQAAAF